MTRPSDWIAPAGLRRIDPTATETLVPAAPMEGLRLSLAAKGRYGLLLSYQGEPIDPYEDAVEDEAEIGTAIEELVSAGYVVRIAS